MSDNLPITRVSEPGKFRRRRPALVRIIGRWLLSLLVLGALGGAAVGWGWLQFTAPGPLASKKIVQLPKQADRSEIAARLKEEGVISDVHVFSALAGLNETFRHARLKPGEYEFPANATMQDVMAMMTRGAFVQYKVTIPEGWTSQMVVNRLNEQEELDGTVTQVPPEGALLPETYIVTRGYPRDKLLADMAAAQTKLLEQEWSRRDAKSPIETKEQLVTLASIVEKETGLPEERPMVAAVFLNRLKQKMRLQSDPTVIYGLVGGKGKLDHAITRAELDQETPYNTYQIDGLPPGPIANPGKAAIEAVLMPAETNALYFVANGSGGHAFAATLDEHNANVKKWRAQTAGSDAPAADAPAPAVAKPAADAAKPAADAAKPADPAANGGGLPATPGAAAAPATAAPAAPAAKPGNTVIINGKRVPIPTLKKPKP